MPKINTEVDVELDDFSDQDLIEEMKRRNVEFEFNSPTLIELITKIHEQRRLGKDYERELNCLIYTVIGKIA